MSSSTRRRHGARGCALALLFIATACPVPVAAESAVAGGGGTLSANARIDFRIVIPALLHVAETDDGVLTSSLRSRRGLLSVSSEANEPRATVLVRGRAGQRVTRHSQTRTTTGPYTVASP